jgi:hypothetical protein
MTGCMCERTSRKFSAWNVGTLPLFAHHKSKARRPGRAQPKRGSEASPDYNNPTRTHAEEGQTERSGLVERSTKRGFGVSPDYGKKTARPSTEEKPSAAARPSAAGKGGSRVSPNYGNPTRRHDEKGQAECSGLVERSSEGGFGDLTRLRYSTARPRAEESQAQRTGRAQRGRGVRESPPTTTQHCTPTRRRKPSAAAMPSAAEKGDSGVSPDYGNPTRTHAEEVQAERSGQAERSEDGRFGG